MAARTSASLRLRGRDGPLRAELTWPDGEPQALLVIVSGGQSPPAPDAVTLTVACETDDEARIAVEWAAAHARELGVASGRVEVIR